MKKLLFEDKNTIFTETGKINRVLNELTAINGFFKEHKLGNLNESLVIKFSQDPEKTVCDIYKERIPDINEFTRLKNDKNKILSQMELPSVKSMETGYIRLYLNELSLFDFDEEITLNEDRLQKHLDSFRYYTDNEAILEVHDKLSQIANLLTEVNEQAKFIPLGQHNGSNLNYNLGEVIAFTPRGFEIQKDGFKRAIQKLHN